MDKQTFAGQIAYLSAAYEREISRETAAVYWKQLGSLPDAPFVLAVQQIVDARDNFPRVSVLRAVTQAFMRATPPTALPAPRIDTVAVPRHHAKLIGADPDQYVKSYMRTEKS